MDSIIVPLAVGVAAGVIFWALRRALRPQPAATATTPAATSASAPKPAEPKPAAATATATASSTASSTAGSTATGAAPARGSSRHAAAKAKDLPSVVDEDEDVDITTLTASPGTEADKEDDAPPSSKKDTSTIAVIYEDEAAAEQEVTSPFARILVHAEGETDQGHVRKRNEDSFLVFPECSLFAVADGMGGYAGGAVASALAMDTMRRAFERNVFDGKVDAPTPVPRRGREIACAIQMANQAIAARAKSDPKLAEMGTTVVAARFSPNKQRVYIGHVGDSRCYRLRGSTLRQLTTDHTMGALGVKGPGAAHLSQAVGVRPTIRIDTIVDKPRADDIYLLCSDGLSKMASNDQIRDVLLAEPDLESAMYTLIELAKDRGGKDNVTVILIKIIERAPGLAR